MNTQCIHIYVYKNLGMLTSDSFPLSFSGLLLSPDEVMGVLTSVSPMGGSPFVGVTIPGSDVLPGLKLG